LELIQMHWDTFLPFSCIAGCLSSLSMYELWMELGQHLISTGQEQEMYVLLDWTWAASVASGAKATPTLQLGVLPLALLAEAGPLGYLDGMVQHWLLGLAGSAAVPQQVRQLTSVVGLLQQFVSDQCAWHQADNDYCTAVGCPAHKWLGCVQSPGPCKKWTYHHSGIS